MKSMERNNTKHETNEEWKKKEKPKYKGGQNWHIRLNGSTLIVCGRCISGLKLRGVAESIDRI